MHYLTVHRLLWYLFAGLQSVTLYDNWFMLYHAGRLTKQLTEEN